MLFLLGLLYFIGYLMPDCFKSYLTLLRLFAITGAWSSVLVKAAFLKLFSSGDHFH